VLGDQTPHHANAASRREIPDLDTQPACGDLLPATAAARCDHLRRHIAALALGVAPLSRRGGFRSSVLGFACGRRGSRRFGLRPNEGPQLLGEPRTVALCCSREPARTGGECPRNVRSMPRSHPRTVRLAASHAAPCPEYSRYASNQLSTTRPSKRAKSFTFAVTRMSRFTIAMAAI
jgi:hypothetical protein